MFSPLATRAKKLRDVKGSRTLLDGVCLHTTGRSVFLKAGSNSEKGLAAAVKYYTKGGAGFPNYIIGHKGEIIQTASEAEPNWHAAWKKAQVKEYKAWEKTTAALPKKYLWWGSRWQDEPPRNYASPLSLLQEATDGRSYDPNDDTRDSPNDDFCGIEGLWHPEGWTPEMYISCAQLCLDIAERHEFPIEFPLPSIRLLGHEDLCPITRTTESGVPWDPGVQLNWHKLEEEIKNLIPSSGMLDESSRDRILNPWSL